MTSKTRKKSWEEANAAQEKISRALSEVRARLSQSERGRMPLWPVASALNDAYQHIGQARRLALLTIGQFLAGQRAFLDVVASLSADLLEERADRQAIDLLALLADALGDTQRGVALRQLRDAAPDATSDDEQLNLAMTELLIVWRKQALRHLSPYEAMDFQFRALAQARTLGGPSHTQPQKPQASFKKKQRDIKIRPQ